MPRRRRYYEEVEIKPPREERIIIYATKETKTRWQKLAIDADVKNYEDFANLLLDIYELSAKYLGERRIEELKRKLEEILGVSIRMNIVK